MYSEYNLNSSFDEGTFSKGDFIKYEFDLSGLEFYVAMGSGVSSANYYTAFKLCPIISDITLSDSEIII